MAEGEQHDDLYTFTRWFISECSSVPAPPFKDGVVRVGQFTGITLFRQPPYQVQLWTCDPNSNIPEHGHPGVDVVQIYLWGQVHLTHQGQPVVSDDMMVEKEGKSAAYGATIRVRPGETHGAKIGPMGGSFLTLQKWIDGEPRSVDTAWEGEPLSEDHSKRIADAQAA
jgi:quercetin dioxygenase-like cupin family protein